MMQIRIILVGKIREKYLRDGFEDYSMRIRPYGRVDLVEIKDEPVQRTDSPGNVESAVEAEGRRILASLRRGETLVALDRRGEMFSSEEFARWVGERAIYGQSRLAFAIGGPEGLSGPVFREAGLVLSLGPMTFPHQMVPLLLLEQIYRAFRIISGEPYHR